jgi:hypothetical protein
VVGYLVKILPSNHPLFMQKIFTLHGDAVQTLNKHVVLGWIGTCSCDTHVIPRLDSLPNTQDILAAENEEAVFNFGYSRLLDSLYDMRPSRSTEIMLNSLDGRWRQKTNPNPKPRKKNMYCVIEII